MEKLRADEPRSIKLTTQMSPDSHQSPCVLELLDFKTSKTWALTLTKSLLLPDFWISRVLPRNTRKHETSGWVK